MSKRVVTSSKEIETVYFS